MNKLDWIKQASPAFNTYTKRATKPFTIEEARTSVQKRIPAPPEQRWWGEIAQNFIKRGLIKAVGYAPARSSNGSPKPVYVRAV